MSEKMTVEQSDGSHAARPWGMGNALKNAAGGVLGLASIQAVVYAASVGAQVVQSLARGGPLDVGLWAPNATIMACVGVVATMNLLLRKDAPSNERFAQGLEGTARQAARGLVFGGGVAGFAALGAAVDPMVLPGLVGLAISSAGVAASVVRAGLINLAVEPESEVESAVEGIKNQARSLGAFVGLGSFKSVVDGKVEAASREAESKPLAANRPKP